MSKKFGDYLRELRESRGLTLREVEKIARVSNAYLSQIERDKRSIPNLKILMRLADAYGVSLEELVKAAEEASNEDSVDAGTSTPDSKFVSRGYERLSEEGKHLLTEYLRFLAEKDKKQSK